MKNFKQLKIWSRGVEIASKTFRLGATFPAGERFGLTAQMTRAAVSIAANIAEGSSRSSAKDQARFIEIAMGSSFELETHLLIAQELGFGDPIVRNDVLASLMEEQKMIASFRNKLIQ